MKIIKFKCDICKDNKLRCRIDIRNHLRNHIKNEFFNSRLNKKNNKFTDNKHVIREVFK